MYNYDYSATSIHQYLPLNDRSFAVNNTYEVQDEGLSQSEEPSTFVESLVLI